MLVTLTAASVAYLGAALLLDRHGQREDPKETYDAIVVLGCRVMPSGQPSRSLASRARRAAELQLAGVAPTIVLTGGIGEHPPSEAVAAAAIVLELGVAGDAVVLEERSTTTEENARYAAALVDARRVLVVTDAYHVFRAERVFRRHFDEVRCIGSLGPTLARVRGALREVVAVSTYALRGRL